MVSFILGIALLLLGYFIYSRIVERLLAIDPKRATPAVAHPDGVDYVPMKPWRIYLIQFLNIAGVGPICGAIMGAQFGTASFLWIVFGSIFAGAVHDFVAGYISLRKDGASLPTIHGLFLGNNTRKVMNWFTLFLLILTGAVFVNTPALLLTGIIPDWNAIIWIVLIFAYYFIATLVPIDKLIGKIYPIFGLLLLAMALALVLAFVHYRPCIPEVWDGLQNKHPNAEHTPLFPMMFISIACGAISGFHATQSPLMARCMVNEKQCRPIFYGAMITEGIVALIWAAAATVFYHDPQLQTLTQGKSGNAMVGVIANNWFPEIVALICLLGVISAAITTGDTALRSARLILAESLHMDQKKKGKRLLVATPIFVASAAILVFSIVKPEGFDIIWRYFAWSNQVLATVTLWAITVYLSRITRGYWITLIPAMFMTMVTGCFLFVAEKEGFGTVIPREIGYAIGGTITLAVSTLVYLTKIRPVGRMEK